MGLRVVVVRLQNCGTIPYVLEGYPTIGLLDENGDQLSFTSHRGSAGAFEDAGPKRHVLQPGASVNAALTWRNTVTGGMREAVTADVLAVAPSKGAPAQHLQVVVDIGTTGRVDVTAWQEGTPSLRR